MNLLNRQNYNCYFYNLLFLNVLQYVKPCFVIGLTFRGDWGKVGFLENFGNMKKFKNSKKNSKQNIEYRQMFTCNNHGSILIRNLDRVQHVKDVSNSRGICIYIVKPP